MRPTFGREYIENEFQRIADGLSGPLTVYLMEQGGAGQVSIPKDEIEMCGLIDDGGSRSR